MPDSFGGYIKVWRSLAEHPLWTKVPDAWLRVALGILLRANWKPAKWDDGERQIDIPAGTFVTSRPRMTEFCRVSDQQYRDALTFLERTTFITVTRTRRYHCITVVNWDTYQGDATGENHNENPERTAKEPSKNRQRTKIEEGKKEEVKDICASPDGNARVGSLPSIDNPPLGTTEPDALFPVESARPKLTRCVTPQQEAWFSQWWSEYWLHKAKKAAREAFLKHVKTEARFQQVMAATRAQNSEMLSREPGKRPHGASWLNGERWEDEQDAPSRGAAGEMEYPELPQ